jgi:hypothetical protein
MCGSIMNDPTPAQVKVFGKPKCCNLEMARLPTKNIHAVIKALDVLKVNLEKELVKDFGCDKYLKVSNE